MLILPWQLKYQEKVSMFMAEKRQGLGRGLADLGLSEILGASPTTVLEHDSAIEAISLEKISTSPFQSRKHFDEHKLNELAETIRHQGVIQPLLVRKIDHNRFELIAGERRLRASQLAELKTVPCIIQDIDDSTAAMINVLENLHREDLNVIEEAEGIRQLIEKHHVTHAEVAQSLGQSRSSVTNKLRLLSLSPYVIEALRDRKIETGHAKCLMSLNINNQNQWVDRIAQRQLSVRALEALLKDAPEKATIEPKPQENPFLTQAAEEISATLKAKASIKPLKNDHGQITIRYTSAAQLNAIIAQMKKTD